MVASYGKGFPLFLRVSHAHNKPRPLHPFPSQNKIFIHRGLPYERLSSFIKRLTDDYSTAEVRVT